MRVAYVAAQCPPHGIGGIGTYVQILSRLMAAAGHDVTVISAAPGQQRSSSIERGVRIERFPAARPERLWTLADRLAPGVVSRLRPAVSAALAVARVRRRFDVVEVPEWKAEGLLLKLLRPGPIVVHLHLALALQERWNGRPRSRLAAAERMERWTARRGRARTAASRMTTRLPDGSDWLDPATVTIVPPLLREGPWATCPPVTTTDAVVLAVGRMEHRKAPDVLMEALGILRSDVPGLHGIFVGQPYATATREPYDEWLLARAEQLGVRCEIHPPTTDEDELLSFYARARVVAVPSRFETLSMVAFEGFACGRPVVMTDAVGAAEWFGPHVPEAVVPAEDARALAAAIRPLLLDAERAHAIGVTGRAAVGRMCSADEVVGRRMAVYRSVAPPR